MCFCERLRCEIRSGIGDSIRKATGKLKPFAECWKGLRAGMHEANMNVHHVGVRRTGAKELVQGVEHPV